MKADFWHERWAENKIGFHLDEVNPYLVEFWPQLKLPAQSHVLVPLAGKSLDIVWLIQQGFYVHAIELSELAVKSFFAEQALPYEIETHPEGVCYKSTQLEFWVADFFEFADGQFQHVAAIYDRAALIALPDEMRNRYCDHLMQLTGNKPQLLITLDYLQNEMSGPPFAVQQAEVEMLYTKYYPQRLKPNNCVDVLKEHPHFEKRGLTGLLECVYLLQVTNK